MRPAAAIAAMLTIAASLPLPAQPMTPRAAFAHAYEQALRQEKCAFVDRYLLDTRPGEAKGRTVGAVKPGLERPLARLQRLRAVARVKGFVGTMRSTEAHWRKLDATADYVCQWDPMGTPQAFEAALDAMEAQLGRL